jgi:hypothetical protein
VDDLIGRDTRRPVKRRALRSRWLLGVSPLWSLVELIALAAVAVAQPVLEVYQNDANTLVLRRPGTTNLVFFTLIVTFAAPLGLWVVELVAGLLGATVRSLVHLAFVAILGGIVAVNAAKRLTDLGGKPVGAIALVTGVGLAVLVSRFAEVRSWLRWLALAAPVFAGLFLFASPVSRVFADDPRPASGVRVARPAPVVMVVFDEFPTASLLDGNGHINRQQFPNFAALADDATWYRNETTVGQETPTAVPAMLTGKYPPGNNKLAIAANYPESLFTLLGSKYRMNVREVVTHLCPRRLCPEPVKGGALRSLLDEASRIWRQIASPRGADPRLGTTGLQVLEIDPDAPAKMHDFTKSIEASGQPRFDFLHVLLPHQPWNLLPDGVRYDAPSFPPGYDFLQWFDAATAAHARERHLLQLQYTDELIGELLDRLHRLGTYDKSLIVVTADHGVAFTPGSPVRGVSKPNAHEIMWTPLFVKAPRQSAGEVSDARVLSIDVLPTIADVLGVHLPWPVDGAVAKDGPAPARDDRLLLESRLSSLKPKSGKFLHFDGRAGFEEMLRSGVPPDSGDPTLRLFRLPPFGGLVGMRPEQLATGPATTFEAELDKPEAFRAVDPARDPPVYVTGSVKADRPVTVAVSINGVVAGWANSYVANLSEPKGDEARAIHRRRFWMLVPPSLLGRGSVDVKLFAVGGAPGSLSLSSLPLAEAKVGGLTVAPASSSKNTSLTVKGERFEPGETVRVRIRTLATVAPLPRAIDVCRAIAKPDGSFTCKGQIVLGLLPQLTLYGRHPVVARGARSSIVATGTFEITL